MGNEERVGPAAGGIPEGVDDSTENMMQAEGL
jgi:hypothetical protein